MLGSGGLWWSFLLANRPYLTLTLLGVSLHAALPLTETKARSLAQLPEHVTLLGSTCPPSDVPVLRVVYQLLKSALLDLSGVLPR